MLQQTLVEYVRFLAATESSFSHATALSTYGNIYPPCPLRPDWLLKGDSGTCFNNAGAYALQRKDVFYAEGYALDSETPVPVQHAWLVNDAGEALDPTWSDGSDHVYLGITFEQSFVAEMLSINKNEPGILVNIDRLRRHLRAPGAMEEAIERGQRKTARRYATP